MTARRVRTRIAPSPTGEPHIGNMYAALFCKAFAEEHNGQFILRIEDTDRTRYVPGAVQMLHDALTWLHLEPDEGPLTGGPFAPYTQSERLPLYHQLAEQLVTSGHGYYCFCTPERLAQLRAGQEARHEPSHYDRVCIRLSSEEVQERLRGGVPHTVRLHIPHEGSVTFDDKIRGTVTFDAHTLTDHILLKSDGYPTSHLAIPADDHLMEISHVIRAEEWLSSVPYYVLLYQAFGWQLPVFAHLPVLRNADRSKMSKRKNNTSVTWYRNQGFLPEAIVNFLALLGWSHPEGKEIFSFTEFRHLLTLERIVKSGPIFDTKKLEWMNGVYIRQLSVAELAERVQPFLETTTIERSYLERILPLVQERLRMLSEVSTALEPFVRDPDPTALPFATAIKRVPLPELRQGLELATAALEQLTTPDAGQFEERIRTLAAKLGWKAGDLFMGLRVAITGSSASPPLFAFCEAIGWGRALHRLHAGIDALPTR
ncbi:MAG: glutamate--tRNA ligase [Chloroflexi bacterium]|nr:glutamate--tRNA ligase [Chloroflexota bacterium]